MDALDLLEQATLTDKDQERLKGLLSRRYTCSAQRITSMGLTALGEALRGNVSIRLLQLDLADIGDEGVAHIAKALDTNAGIRKLFIGNNSIGPDGAQLVARALCTNTTLRELHIPCNSLYGVGASHLAAMLRVNATLRLLDVGACYMGEEGAAALAEALRCNTTLRSLSVGSNRIGSEGARHLCKVLRVNSMLRELHMGHNDLGDDGAVYVADMLRGNSTLQRLSVGVNQIMRVDRITEALQVNSALRDINLAWNTSDPDWAHHVAAMLCGNSALTRLDMWRTRLGPQGARAIAHALRNHNSTLRHLNLHRCDIGDEGATYLAEALRENMTLCTLDLSISNIGPDGAAAFANTMASRPSPIVVQCHASLDDAGARVNRMWEAQRRSRKRLLKWIWVRWLRARIVR